MKTALSTLKVAVDCQDPSVVGDISHSRMTPGLGNVQGVDPRYFPDSGSYHRLRTYRGSACRKDASWVH